MKLKPTKIYDSFAEAMAAIFNYPPGQAQVHPYNGKWIIITSQQLKSLYEIGI